MKNVFVLGALALAVVVAGCGKSGLDQAERKVMPVTCANNLRQVGLGFRIWSGDHDDKYPFDVSTNAGGVMELVTAKDGLRQNGYLMLQCMSNELTIPIIVVCPQDKAKSAAQDWASLTASNVSYVFPATNKILLVCPIDGNVLYSDGTVLDKDGKVPSHE
jgi:hypothetical protein